MTHFSKHQKSVFLAVFCILLLMIFFVSRELYNGFYSDIIIEKKREQVESKKEQLSHLKEQDALYASPWFLEKFAKSSLNKMLPGEKVLVISDTEISPLSINEKQTYQTLSPLESWKEYFFGNKVLLESRKSTK